MKQIQLKLSGGFHNVAPIYENVSEDAYCDFENELANLSEIFSEEQRERLNRHFCGIPGCTCGGFLRAEIENLGTPIYVSFHIGRGGRFNNPGHYRFSGEFDFQMCLRICNDFLFTYKEDENGNQLPENEWKVCDESGRILLQGREEIESRTGIINFDEDYNSFVTRTLDECGDKEWDALRESYGHDYMSQELVSEIRKHFNLK